MTLQFKFKLLSSTEQVYIYRTLTSSKEITVQRGRQFVKNWRYVQYTETGTEGPKSSSQCGSAVSFSRQSLWCLRWKHWPWFRGFSENFGFPVSELYHPSSMPTHISFWGCATSALEATFIYSQSCANIRVIFRVVHYLRNSSSSVAQQPHIGPSPIVCGLSNFEAFHQFSRHMIFYR